jgi:diguanylate cyclase (GGDEF)-like protein/PAS domain S-box-containing protein
MLTVWNCIAYEHDPRLLALAVAICALSSFTAISLLHHVRRCSGRARKIWLIVSATTTGFGIWATHFIAMLAFEPGVPNAYNITLTFLSLIAAIVLTAVGFAVAIAPDVRAAAWLGGAIVGAGIATMHYTGMAAFEIQGHILWDPTLVAASIVLGALFGSAALPIGLHPGRVNWRLLGALLLTLAICSHHFTAMGAAALLPDPTILVPNTALPSGLLAVAMALATLIIIGLALAGAAIEMRDRRRGELEAERMRGLANAAVEGLLVCDGDKIVTVNNSFALLVGSSTERLIGTTLEQTVPEPGMRANLLERPDHPLEGDIPHADGSRIPVELISRPVDFGGRPHRAIAVRDLRARKQAEQHIRYLAHHDALTGLPNRNAFNKRLDREIEEVLSTGTRLAVLCLDLDRFKDINDVFGHAVGDQMLQVFANRVTALLESGQTMARLSGDEFAIILPHLSSPATAGRIAENILHELRTAMTAADADSLISTSIGIAICPDDAADRQTLLSHADTALYRAKNEGRAVHRFFEAAMGAAVRDRRLLEHDLRRAIPQGELNLVYQPQKDIRNGNVVGFEALLRWKHPVRGEVLPSEFIPLAEETGLIFQIGEWVMRSACREAAAWPQPLTVAVNVSARQIHSEQFAATLHDILFETKLAPNQLELEITETALIRDLARALSTLRLVKALGVRIAMDDFGTGYSSLSNLMSFPFDKIKIDASFIRSVNANDQAATIVRAVLGLGRGLRLPVLAEGVETHAELQFLQRELCDEAQGYFLGRPAAITSFRHLTHGAGTSSAANATITQFMPRSRPE